MRKDRQTGYYYYRLGAREIFYIEKASTRCRKFFKLTHYNTEAWSVFTFLCVCITSTSFTQKPGLSSAMPSMNMVYKKTAEMKATKQARGYSHAYQDGASAYVSTKVRNSVPAVRNRICGEREIQNYSRK